VGRDNIFKLTIENARFFRNKNILKYTWTSPDGKIHNQIDHILIERRSHLSILDVQNFKGADCDTDHSLVVAKVRERLTVNKKAAQNSDGKRFNFRKDINRTWENIKRNIETSVKRSLGLH
jgi:hypothetical protein